MLKTVFSSPMPLGASLATIILLCSIAIGAAVGSSAPIAGKWLGQQVDYTLLLLVGSLFFSVRLDALLEVKKHWLFMLAALVANFVIVPLIGYGVATFFLGSQPLVFVGLVIYFMSPCTDWFLGFTRLSEGNVALGSTLIPINMTLQLLLYPLYMILFAQHAVTLDSGVIGTTLFQWFLAPLVVALSAHKFLRARLGTIRLQKLLSHIDQGLPWIMGLLVMEIFAANIDVILLHSGVFAKALVAVFIFFVLTFLMGEGLSRLLHFRYPEHALLSMTTAARNAPLMLAVTMVALPGQPLIYASLIIGMLLEFPHLTALCRVLLGSQRRQTVAHLKSAAGDP
ncbi:arsenic resistance protein [Pseudomonas sp. S31]|uniref:arsenic resistance protein n=1 Tax=Pseudomonas sp. S31 TaxID=1564473 RepID=UPI0019144B7F|nr:arsenic resistance protein [Pseudomonas sp. S31]MBK4998985.1 arsenic resistance protein [Pseudomonas sp. S31]